MHGNDGNARYGARCSFTMLHKVTGFTNVSPKFWCARRTLSSWEVSRPSPLASKASKVCLSTCRGQLSPNMSKHVETKGWDLGDLGDWSCELSRLSQDQLIIWAHGFWDWEWLGDGNGTSRSLCGSKNALDSCFNKTLFADFNSKTSSIFRSGKVIWHNITIYWRDKCRPLATYGHLWYYWCQFLWNVPLVNTASIGWSHEWKTKPVTELSKKKHASSRSLEIIWNNVLYIHTCTYLLEFFP